jgi:hypothetical protein
MIDSPPEMHNLAFACFQRFSALTTLSLRWDDGGWNPTVFRVMSSRATPRPFFQEATYTNFKLDNLRVLYESE